MPKVLSSFQTNYLANLDKHNITSQRSERIDFYCNDEEADSKMFPYLKFLFVCLNRIIVLLDSDAAVIY